MSKVNNFQDEFTFDDILIAEDVTTTHNCGMSRIALCAPDQINPVGPKLVKEGYHGCLSVITLRLHYAIQVWCRASIISAASHNGFEKYWWLDWVPGKGGFNNLENTDTSKKMSEKQMLQRFWKLLEKIANSGEVQVTEGYWVNGEGKGMCGPRVTGNVIVDAKTADEIQVDDVQTYPYCKQMRTFKWNEIKDFFIELTLDQLRLTMPDKLHNHKEIDDTLLEACFNWDTEMIKMAMARGANINCLDRDGSSVIIRAMDSLGYDDEKIPQCEKIIDLLLSYSADINLFGYEAMSPLICAYDSLYNTTELVEFLLERGASPNTNCFCADITHNSKQRNVRSTLLDILDPSKMGENDIKLGKILRNAGGRRYVWDYTPWNDENTGKSVVIMVPADNNGSLFTDNSAWPIGNATQLTFEDQNDNQIVVKFDSVADDLAQWYADFRQNCTNRNHDWLEWKQRGRELADRVAQLLPDNVALFYLYDIEEYLEKDGSIDLAYLVSGSLLFRKSYPLRIK